MPYLMNFRRCPVCYGSHDFCTDDPPSSSGSYSFTCPKENLEGVIQFTVPGWSVPDRPAGSVVARVTPPG